MSAFLPPSTPDLASAAGRPDPRPVLRHVAPPASARPSERPSGRWWFAFDQWLPMPASDDDEFVLA